MSDSRRLLGSEGLEERDKHSPYLLGLPRRQFVLFNFKISEILRQKQVTVSLTNRTYRNLHEASEVGVAASGRAFGEIRFYRGSRSPQLARESESLVIGEPFGKPIYL